jgi:DNA-binding LytR/AlgR family response regulator
MSKVIPSPALSDCPCLRDDKSRFLDIRTADGCSCIAFRQIAYMRGDGNSTEIYVLGPDGRAIDRWAVVGRNLGEFDARIPPCFARVNQRYTVNIYLVAGYSRTQGLLLSCEMRHIIEPSAKYCDPIAHRLPFWPIGTRRK